MTALDSRDLMTIVAHGEVPGCPDRMWLHAKFDDDTGHRYGEVSVDTARAFIDSGVGIVEWRSSICPPFDGGPTSRHVYVIACVKSGEPLCKVGIASSPERRVRQLSTASPYPLSLVMAARTRHPELAEVLAHSCLAEVRLNGEWFAVDPELACEVVRQSVEAYRWHQ